MKPTIRAALIPILMAMPACAPTACWESDGLDRINGEYPTDVTDVVDASAEAASTDPAGDVATGDTDSPGDTVSGEVARTGLQGTWAMAMVQNKRLMEYYEMTITDLFVATVDADQLAAVLVFCKEDTRFGDQGSPGDSVMPETVVAALAAAKVTIPLASATNPAPTSGAWTWGLKLAHPETDAMPTVPGDASVWDQDQDGKPAVTITVMPADAKPGDKPLGSRYMARRALWQLSDGTAGLSDDWRSGPLTSTIDQSRLGADPEALNMDAPITDRDPAVQSTWVMHRVAVGYDCATLLAAFPAVVTPPAP